MLYISQKEAYSIANKQVFGSYRAGRNKVFSYLCENILCAGWVRLEWGSFLIPTEQWYNINEQCLLIIDITYIVNIQEHVHPV